MTMTNQNDLAARLRCGWDDAGGFIALDPETQDWSYAYPPSTHERHSSDDPVGVALDMLNCNRTSIAHLERARPGATKYPASFSTDHPAPPPGHRPRGIHNHPLGRPDSRSGTPREGQE